MGSRLSVLLVTILFLLFGIACDGGLDEATGVYKGKGVTATFPTGWETFSGVPHSVVARRDPNSSAKVTLAVQDAPGVTMEEYLAQQKPRLSNAGMKEVDDGPIGVNGVEGRWTIVDQTLQGQPFRAITYTFLTNDKLYTVMGLTEAAEFGPWESRFDQVAKSLDFE